MDKGTIAYKTYLDRITKGDENMELKNMVFNIQEILRQATEENPPGDIHLDEIRKKVWDTVTPEAKSKFKKAGNTQSVFDKRVSGILTNLSSEKKGKMYVERTAPMTYRLIKAHPKVQRWIKEKWYEKGITIGGFSYED